jgi:hypothetical protein
VDWDVLARRLEAVLEGLTTDPDLSPFGVLDLASHALRQAGVPANRSTNELRALGVVVVVDASVQPPFRLRSAGARQSDPWTSLPVRLGRPVALLTRQIVKLARELERTQPD